MCLAIRYLKDHRLLLPVGMSVGEGYVPDPVLGAKALNGVEPGGVLLADAGFDAGQVFRGAKGKFIPMIRLKGGGEIKDTQREEARKIFRAEIYRLRAVGEGVFGGLKTRLDGRLRNLIPAVSRKESLILVLCYVVRVLLALLHFLVVIQCLRKLIGVRRTLSNPALAVC